MKKFNGGINVRAKPNPRNFEFNGQHDNKVAASALTSNDLLGNARAKFQLGYSRACIRTTVMSSVAGKPAAKVLTSSKRL